MNLPNDFEELLVQQIGQDEYTKLKDALSTTSPTSIRINKYKENKNTEPEEALSMIERDVPWCSDGKYLTERPSFTFDPLLHAGCYYVQEASSMYLAHILRTYVDKPVTALDLCAAPGGKSTLAISTLPEGSLLMANEVMRQRCHILAENLVKWGNPNIIVTNNYAEDFQPLGQLFDVVICDAPCSGEGMFRKDEGAITEWSIDNVHTCQARQKEIITNIWPCIKPGGLLVYSTCTFNHFEDEDIVEWMTKELGAEKLELKDDETWGIVNGHFFPHKTTGEGFFICPVRKREDADEDNGDHTTLSNNSKKKKDKNKKSITTIKTNSKEYAELSSWLNAPNDYVLFQDKDTYKAFPARHADKLENALKHLNVVHSGISLATTKGNALQPEHSLAMSNDFAKDAFENVELDKEKAIAYLRTEAITVEAKKGYILLTYKGFPLGFGKNIGNRVNNLYPSEWKIRKTY